MTKIDSSVLFQHYGPLTQVIGSHFKSSCENLFTKSQGLEVLSSINPTITHCALINQWKHTDWTENSSANQISGTMKSISPSATLHSMVNKKTRSLSKTQAHLCPLCTRKALDARHTPCIVSNSPGRTQQLAHLSARLRYYAGKEDAEPWFINAHAAPITIDIVCM